MTGIRQLAAKLRRAADVLDELLSEGSGEAKGGGTPAQWSKVRKDMRDLAEQKKRAGAKGGKPHWTQTPEGRKRMSKISRKSAKARVAKRRANARAAERDAETPANSGLRKAVNS